MVGVPKFLAESTRKNDRRFPPESAPTKSKTVTSVTFEPIRSIWSFENKYPKISVPVRRGLSRLSQSQQKQETETENEKSLPFFCCVFRVSRDPKQTGLFHHSSRLPFHHSTFKSIRAKPHQQHNTTLADTENHDCTIEQCCSHLGPVQAPRWQHTAQGHHSQNSASCAHSKRSTVSQGQRRHA